jgi:hypothetical protein
MYERSPKTLKKRNVFGIEHKIVKIISIWVVNCTGRVSAEKAGVNKRITFANPE